MTFRPSLTHIALHVNDLPASIDFYARFCALQIIHDRSEEKGDNGERSQRIVWMAEAGREQELILVMMAGGKRAAQLADDYSHLGFAVASTAEVDAIAARAAKADCLLWQARQEPYPVGYYCGLVDPDGNAVEFSYGQPLGPGASPLT